MTTPRRSGSTLLENRQLVPESKRYVAGNVILQWCSLLANIAMMTAICAAILLPFLENADDVKQFYLITFSTSVSTPTAQQ